MCRSMEDIRSTAAEIRRGKKKKIEDRRRKKLQGKNIMAPLLHRAAIINAIVQYEAMLAILNAVSWQATTQTGHVQLC